MIVIPVILGCALLQDPPAAAEPPTPIVATHYFYWYRWPDRHFDQPGAPGREGHRRHLPEPESVSYESADWHRGEFRDMAAAGIDLALPVYWGAPGAYERAGIRFSVDGLAPMVKALDALAEVGEEGVKLGLFYDTTTLLRSVRGLPHDAEHPERPDLTTAEGVALFCDTIVEYFERVPERHWGRFRGRPLVVLYVSAFAGRWDETLGEALGRAFAARFPGERPWLVADASWGEIGQSMHTSWGAALHGPKLFPGLAQVGPGYDDTPVPGRHTPIREREQGRFYAWSWQQAVLARPELVLIETWNEMHEGTEICETIEAGRRYLDLTREWTDRLARGDAGPPIEEPAALRARPDLSWGAEASGCADVSVDYGADPVTRSGLREVALDDGPCRVEGGALLAGEHGVSISYLYFQVSDHWLFDGEVELRVVVTGEGTETLRLQYDSTDPRGTLEGAYTTVSARREAGGSSWIFDLKGARFANRQNGGADLRLVVDRSSLTVRTLRVERPLR